MYRIEKDSLGENRYHLVHYMVLIRKEQRENFRGIRHFHLNGTNQWVQQN